MSDVPSAAIAVGHPGEARNVVDRLLDVALLGFERVRERLEGVLDCLARLGFRCTQLAQLVDEAVGRRAHVLGGLLQAVDVERGRIAGRVADLLELVGPGGDGRAEALGPLGGRRTRRRFVVSSATRADERERGDEHEKREVSSFHAPTLSAPFCRDWISRADVPGSDHVVLGPRRVEREPLGGERRDVDERLAVEDRGRARSHRRQAPA